jgi:hypothetical protein
VNRAIPFVLALFATASMLCAEMREWSDRAGRKFTAEILANDAWRVTFALPDRSKAVLPLAQLSAADVQFVAAWRKANPGAPLVDPQRLAPWPGEVSAADIEIHLKREDPKAPAFLYEGAHFIVQSDVKLPLGVVRDLNGVFEGTRAALMALPFGLHAGGEEEKYPVLLFSNADQYGQAGGGTASGGYFHGPSGRMLILLPNLGIRTDGATQAFDYQKNLFVVKHEVTHQILQRWGDAFPVWFNEGLAEVIAATPYTRGRYTFTAMDTAIGTYAQKWRNSGDQKPMILIPPSQMMEFTNSSWEARVAGKSAYELYNSAALFTYFLLRHDGTGDGSAVAGFLDVLRREIGRELAEAARSPLGQIQGDPMSEVRAKAVADFIRRGRSDEKLAADFANFLKRRGLRVEFESPLLQVR